MNKARKRTWVVRVYFKGEPMDPMDKFVTEVAERNGGDYIGGGTNMRTGARDCDYHFKNDAGAVVFMAALKKEVEKRRLVYVVRPYGTRFALTLDDWPAKRKQ